MGIFDFFKKKEETRETRYGVKDSPAFDSAMAELQADMFPNGPTDMARDVSRVLALFHDKLSINECLGACRTSRIIKSQKPDAGLLYIGIMTRVPQQAGESV